MDDVDQAALLAGFRAGDEALSAAFFDLLMAAVRSRLKSRWRLLRRAHEEIEDRCAATVVEWRASGLLRDGESLQDLASRLVNQNVQAVQRVLDMERQIKKDAKAAPREAAPDPEGEAAGDELRQTVWDLQATLDPKHQRVLEAYAEAERYGKKTVAEILGVSEDNAWKLAQRAREALAAAIRTKGLKASDFFDAAETEGAGDG